MLTTNKYVSFMLYGNKKIFSLILGEIIILQTSIRNGKSDNIKKISIYGLKHQCSEISQYFEIAIYVVEKIMTQYEYLGYSS